MAVFTETIALEDKVSPNAKAAQTALSSMTKGLAAAQAELVKTASLGDQAGYDKALASMTKYSQGIAKLGSITPKAAAAAAAAPLPGAGPAGPAQGPPIVDPKPQVDAWANAAHAAEVGKQVIGTAIAGIKAAFASLAAGDVKGAVAGVTDAIAGIASALDLVVPGLGQAVSAVIKIAGGLVGITAGLIQSGMEFAIEASQAKQQMLSMFDAMGDGIVTGAQLDDALSELADQIGISKDTLAGFTKEFLQMGVTGQDQLMKLTLAAESANAIVGEGGAAAFTSLQKKIQLAAATGGQIKLDPKFLKMVNASGAKIDDLAAGLGLTADQLKGASVDADKLGDILSDAVINRGADPLKRLSGSFGEIKKKFMQDIGDLFEDIDVGPFMDQVKELFQIFGQATPAGQALKAGIQGFFTETFAIAAKLVPIVKHFMLDLIIYGLQAYIALQPTVKAIKDFLTSAEGVRDMGILWEVVKTALVGLGVAVGIVVGLFLVMAAATVAVGTAIWACIGAFVAIGVEIASFISGLIAGAIEAGVEFVNGLVAGITNGGSAVVDAVKGLAGSAVDTFKSALGIASPSKVMMELGGHTGTGFAIGMGNAANDVSGAAGDMSSMAVQGASGGAAAGAAAGGGGGASSNVFYISVDGAGKNAQEVAEEVVSLVMERMALAAGA